MRLPLHRPATGDGRSRRTAAEFGFDRLRMRVLGHGKSRGFELGVELAARHAAEQALDGLAHRIGNQVVVEVYCRSASANSWQCAARGILGADADLEAEIARQAYVLAGKQAR